MKFNETPQKRFLNTMIPNFRTMMESAPPAGVAEHAPLHSVDQRKKWVSLRVMARRDMRRVVKPMRSPVWSQGD